RPPAVPRPPTGRAATIGIGWRAAPERDRAGRRSLGARARAPRALSETACPEDCEDGQRVRPPPARPELERTTARAPRRTRAGSRERRRLPSGADSAARAP